ncbi:unnamed protein product [Diamesa hyperborea]
MADKKKFKRSKEEIAREFNLPERKSKIDSILKNDESKSYCICRTSDSTRFMICCDLCEEWYHGDCIHITEKEAKLIKKYFCEKCKEDDPTLRTIFRSTSQILPNSVVATEKAVVPEKKPKVEKVAKVGTSSNRCYKCDGCRAKNCGKCSACLNRNKRSAHKQRCKKRICIYQVKKKEKEGRIKKRKRSLTPETAYVNPALVGQRHCYGPECKNNARPQSKYCSDACGMNLAAARIFQLLPSRLGERTFTPSVANELNQKSLETIRAKQANVRSTLTELDKRHKELDKLVEQAKLVQLNEHSSENTDLEDEMSMYCITCGHEIHSRTAIRHMEKCFNKYESQASFGSIFKTRIEGNSMFCDFFNAASNTYCKRLRVLCPEHSKDAKVTETDVCGCPLVKNVFELTGEFCRAPKKSCFKHYVWEKIRRAEIDMERVRQWLKMDELLEQERQCKSSMSSRSGLLGLLLHSTYNHEIIEEMIKNRKISTKIIRPESK